MKLRKILATSLAIAMAVATLNVAPAKADVIDSQTAYLDKEVYDVTVPTTASQKFYLDPQGLANEAFGTPATGGQIVGATTMSAINNSSKPVNIEVKAVVIASSAAVTVVTNGALTGLDNVNSNPALKLKITTTSAKAAKAVSKGGITDGTALSASDDVYAAISGASISSEIYGLEAGNYVVTTSAITAGAIKDELYDPSNYKYEMSTSGAAIDLVIGGECTQKTDWSAFVGETPKQELKLDLTFKLTKEDGSDANSAKFEKLANGNYIYDGITSASGTITSVKVDGVDRTAAVGNNYILYNSSAHRLAILSTWPGLGIIGNGNHSVEVVMDGTSYTITLTVS